jgi:hypothetical protein
MLAPMNKPWKLECKWFFLGELPNMFVFAGSGDGTLHAWNINTVQEVIFFNHAFKLLGC